MEATGAGQKRLFPFSEDTGAGWLASSDLQKRGRGAGERECCFRRGREYIRKTNGAGETEGSWGAPLWTSFP